LSADRRTFLGGLALFAGATAAVAQGQTPFAGDPSAPAFPPREHFPLWPGKPPGAPAQPIVPNWTMNNPPPHRELWIRGVPTPEVHVFRAAQPDGSALLDVRLLLETDDGAVILMQYKGILTEGGARLRTAPLFETMPYRLTPPRFLRVAVYQYRFTDSETRRATGAWWRRELISYSQVQSRK